MTLPLLGPMTLSGFSHAWFFVFLLVIVGLVALYIIAQVARQRRMLRFANMELLESVAPKQPTRWRHLSAILLIGALVLFTIAMAGPTDPATSAMCRSSASAKSCRRVAYSRAIESPSKVPAAASPAALAQITTTANICAAGPAPTRCNASTTASAAHEASTQNAVPSEMRTAGFAPSIRVPAACPAAISTSSSNDAASPASA